MSEFIHPKEIYPFWTACMDGDAKEVSSILKQYEKGRGRKRIIRSDGFYCLVLACEFGHDDIIRLLVEEFETPDELIEADQFEGFFLACANGHFKTVSLLLELYSDPLVMIQTRNYGSITIASRGGHHEIAHLLMAIIDRS